MVDSKTAARMSSRELRELGSCSLQPKRRKFNLAERFPFIDHYEPSHSVKLEDLPSSLYRINYPGSCTHFVNGDFTAGDIESFSVKKSSIPFGQSVGKHLKWQSPVTSSFISLFDNARHAYNWAHYIYRDDWARNMWKSDSGSTSVCEIYQINPVKIARSLYKVTDLKPIASPYVNKNLVHFDPEEYLVLHRIPNAAIAGPILRVTGKSRRKRLERPNYVSFRAFLSGVGGADLKSIVDEKLKILFSEQKRSVNRNTDDGQESHDETQTAKISCSEEMGTHEGTNDTSPEDTPAETELSSK